MFKVSGRTIYVYDEISEFWGVGSSDIIEALESLGNDEPINLRINSPGGDVVEGLAIFNAIRRHQGTVNTFNDSLAASCGSYIFAAGDRRVVAQNSMTMVHDPWGVSIGNAEEHRKTADTYDKFAESLIRDYADASGMESDEIRSVMAAETWYTAEECVEAGFATEIGDSVEAEPVEAKSRVCVGIAAKARELTAESPLPRSRGGVTALEIQARKYRAQTCRQRSA